VPIMDERGREVLVRSGSPRARRAGARGRARGKVPRGVRIDVRRTSARQALVASNDAVTGPHGVGHEPARGAAGRADPTALEAPTARRDAAAAPHRASCLFLTSTGVRFARGGLVIDVEAVDRPPYGQSALVSVHWRGWLCYRRRLNLDDPGQRARFVKNVLLSCRQAGITRFGFVAACVTPAALIRLGQAYQDRRRMHLPVDPAAAKARRATVTAAARRAGALRRDPDILGRVAAAIQANGYAGNVTPAVLAYVALTSRLLERPINLAFVGESSAGKNAILDAARALVPPEAVYMFSAGSPRALLYTPEALQHRVVIFKEADSIPDDGPAASAVRALAQDNEMRYEVTMLSATSGKFETQTITKKGPTGLLTTSTCALAHQLNTRVLVMPVADDEGTTTRKVILAKGKEAAGRTRRRTTDIEAFVAFQRWLTLAGERRVVVPFGAALAQAMPKALELRMRRDFLKILSCVQTIALLRRQGQRQRGPSGEIIATLEDYEFARELLLPCFDTVAAGSISAVIRETVEAIRYDENDVSVSGLAERLGISRQLAWWRVRKAIMGGWLADDAPGSGKPARLRRGKPLPKRSQTLPDAGRVQAAFLGVPDAVPNLYYFEFAEKAAAWSDDFSAAECAVRVKRDVRVVRARLERLFKNGLLVRKRWRRYALPVWVRERLREMQEQESGRGG